MDPTASPILFLALLLGVPAVGGGLLLLAARKLRGSAELGWAGALAFGLAYGAGHVIALGRAPSWPPPQSNDALFFAGAIAALAAMVASSRRIPGLAAGAVLGAGNAGALWIVLHRVLAREEPPRQVLLTVAVFVFAATVTFRFERVSETVRGALVPLLLWIVASSIAVAIALTGSADLAQYSACIAAFLGAAVVFGWIFRDAKYSRGLANAALLQLLTLAYTAKVLSDLPLTAMGCLVAAPWLAAVVSRQLEGRRSPRFLDLARLAVVLVACAIALAIAYARHLEQSSSAY